MSERSWVDRLLVPVGVASLVLPPIDERGNLRGEPPPEAVRCERVDARLQDMQRLAGAEDLQGEGVRHVEVERGLERAALLLTEHAIPPVPQPPGHN